jgi:hypothetical protein
MVQIRPFDPHQGRWRPDAADDAQAFGRGRSSLIDSQGYFAMPDMPPRRFASANPKVHP